MEYSWGVGQPREDREDSFCFSDSNIFRFESSLLTESKISHGSGEFWSLLAWQILHWAKTRLTCRSG
jgi:hypothetical protein